jgi:phosphatidylserine decarboxylase
MLPALLDQLFILFQRLLPERQLGRAVRALTRSRTPWLRSLLIRAFVRVYGVNLAEVERPEPEAWETMNAFFTRPLRAGARPVATGDSVVVSPSDGLLEELGYANAGQLLQAKRFQYAIANFLALDAAEAERFSGGATTTIYLAPRDYHRVHMPLSGRVTGMVYVPGRRWAVNRRTVRTVPGLFAANERVILWCESVAGRFAVVLVGALNVASISLAWSGEVPSAGQVVRTDFGTTDPRLRIPAGGLLGQFNLGSTVVVVAERGLVTWDTSVKPGQPIRMGVRLGQHTVGPGPQATR